MLYEERILYLLIPVITVLSSLAGAFPPALKRGFPRQRSLRLFPIGVCRAAERGSWFDRGHPSFDNGATALESSALLECHTAAPLHWRQEGRKAAGNRAMKSISSNVIDCTCACVIDKLQYHSMFFACKKSGSLSRDLKWWSFIISREV